ncbi:LolA-related protein [Xanthomonas perforans]|nr:LolA-related protein [Xanthomonas perforans]
MPARADMQRTQQAAAARAAAGVTDAAALTALCHGSGA